MKSIRLILCLLFLSTLAVSQTSFSYQINNQTSPNQDKDKHCTNLGSALFIELAGRSYASLNFEMRCEGKNRLSFGLGWNNMEVSATKGGDSMPFLLVLGMYSHIYGKGPSYFEIGAGGSYALVDLNRMEIHKDFADNTGPMAINSLVGYRYQMIDGILFRAGFTPLLQLPSNDLWPLIGLSFGYSW